MEIEKILEFDKVKLKWSSLAMTERAKEKIKDVTPFLSENELRKNLKETTESRTMIEKCGTPPLVSMEGIEGALAAARKGDCLTGSQLENVEITLVAIRRLKEYLNRGKQFDSSLAYYEENLNVLENIGHMIGLQIRNGAVDDHATKVLLTIKNEIARTETKMKEKADSIMRSNKEYLSDSFSTLRNGRLCIPVKKEYKFKINGSVLDKSSTGNTLFIEPAAMAGYYEELQILRIDEENEIYRILYTLTALVADSADLMEQNIQTMEKLDFAFSKGKLSIDMDAAEPSVNTDRMIEISDGRHPLMQKDLCVPIQFSLGGERRGVVITGPNTGGKTVAIKTVALNSMMAQCGLHVTCGRANLCMNSNCLCDIGDGQNLSENLSTFSAHIKTVLSILSEINCESLVIMDELGSGTDPTEGMGIAIAILEELRKSGCLFLVTTHYPEVKQYADQTDGVINARMEFDKETLQPLYKMVIGEAGESCAFYVADKLGMPIEMLRTAIKASYGEEEAEKYQFSEAQKNNKVPRINSNAKIQKTKMGLQNPMLTAKFCIGDSVMIYPDKKIGIVCQTVNEKGILRVQLQNKKIWINHKRVKLHVPASQLYPEDYDFSIIFDTVEQRKLSHDMNRKYTEGRLSYDDN
ncbi:MAG: DNA mismatch repair protein MutS [Lachnospiraceae bacterium]